LQWDNDAFRGCGMVVDWLRDRWYYASLVALRATPLSPSELLDVFRAAREANTQVFGSHTIYQECVTRHLGALANGALIKPGQLQGRRRTYTTTALGAELLDSLTAASLYGWSRYGWLVRCARIERHMDPDAPLPAPNPADSDDMVRERLLRRSTALLFAVVLGPKWTFTVLAALASGPLRPYRILAVVDEAVRASPDVVSGHLATPMLNARLETLQQLGLVVRIPSELDRRVSYALTDDGQALMMALEPVARFGMRRNAEMTAAVRAM
jgi:DNA-binding HxlR family transcriptional regulator